MSKQSTQNMWKRKSPEDIRKIEFNLKYSPWRSFKFSVLFCGVTVLMVLLGWRSITRWDDPTDISASISVLQFYMALSFAVMFVGSYLWQLVAGTPYEKTIYLCDKCFESSYLKEDKKCKCGGPLNPIYEYSYEDPEDAQSEATEEQT